MHASESELMPYIIHYLDGASLSGTHGVPQYKTTSTLHVSGIPEAPDNICQLMQLTCLRIESADPGAQVPPMLLE